MRGAAYGLRQALDSVGAFLGPLLALVLMFAYADNFRAVFWWAVLPAALCVLLVIFCRARARRRQARRPPRLADQPRRARPSAPRLLAGGGVGVVFTLARFSEAFLVLRAQDAGLALALVPLVFVWMNLVYALLATPPARSPTASAAGVCCSSGWSC